MSGLRQLRNRQHEREGLVDYRRPLARHLLRILGMLESPWNSRTLSYYIRTYHNQTADWVSREGRELVEAELEDKGWTKVPPAEGWGLYLVDALKGV